MDLIELSKENHNNELAHSEKLNNKISTSITFLTIIGSALIFIFNKVMEYELGFQFVPTVILFLTLFAIVEFVIACIFFYKTHYGYDMHYFPIKEFNNFLKSCYNLKEYYSEKEITDHINEKYKDILDTMSEHNREQNLKKIKYNNRLNKHIVITLVLLFITYAFMYI